MTKISKSVHKILVVDDTYFTRKFLGKTLENICCGELYFAENGLQAIEKAKEVKPDLVMLDISMPGMDGLEVVGKIMEVSSGSKVIMVSASATPATVMQAINKGAVDFISKPFSTADIEASIRKHG